eukprot:668507-Rhodomonas_salina.1
MEEGAQKQCSKHHVFFACTLGFMEHGHALVQWEHSKFDGLLAAGLMFSWVELSTGPAGEGGLDWITGTLQSTDDKGWGATHIGL